MLHWLFRHKSSILYGGISRQFYNALDDDQLYGNGLQRYNETTGEVSTKKDAASVARIPEKVSWRKNVKKWIKKKLQILKIIQTIEKSTVRCRKTTITIKKNQSTISFKQSINIQSILTKYIVWTNWISIIRTNRGNQSKI